MKICKVIGKASASLKHPSLEGIKMVIVQELTTEGHFSGKVHLSADPMGAGDGEIVAVATGGGAGAEICGTKGVCDAAVVAILDSVSLSGREIHSSKPL